MQENCTEFIAYENVAHSGGVASPELRQRSGPRPDRGGGRAAQSASSLDQALPLVQRALKVLADREVSPQLGLLKSTLLQLDSSFSERDYGASTFRDFAEKLEQRGLVTLKHSGRTTVVELSESGARDLTPQDTAADSDMPADGLSSGPAMLAHPTNDDEDRGGEPRAVGPEPVANLAEGVALVRAILAEATTPPRWPMYLRQMKQFIRAARPDFDERRYGALPDLMRACQKDGLLRLERDRQGGLRAFAGPGTFKPAPVPHGWAALETEPTESEAPPPSAPEAAPPPRADDGSVEADDQLAIFGKVSPLDPEPKPIRARRAPRKTPGPGGSPRTLALVDKPKRAPGRAKTEERRPKGAGAELAPRPRRTRATKA
jgi:OST-HTH/LOTUS domain